MLIPIFKLLPCVLIVVLLKCHPMGVDGTWSRGKATQGTI